MSKSMAVKAAGPMMVQRLGRELARLVRREHDAKRLWVRPERDYVEFWILTAETDADTERRLYEACMALQRDHPDANLRFYVLNPALYARLDEPGTIIPPDAEAIPLEAL